MNVIHMRLYNKLNECTPKKQPQKQGGRFGWRERQSHSESAAHAGTAQPPTLPPYYSNHGTSRQSPAPHQTHFISQVSLK